MNRSPFRPWVQRIEALVAAGRARGRVTRAEVEAALGGPATPAALVDEWMAALQAQGIAVAEAEDAVLDATTAGVKRLIERGKVRGYVTFDEVNAALPADRASTELIEDTLSSLGEMGITIIESGTEDDGG
ncbi:RNA polymerase sigma factor region1.1 domain-containing protein [Dankookia sp. P2]|uniref:RNA polymerase sigma factor region1.1 domain-containing protein n=1 Tax=Dankookia sp. P2 TaxID=3423955 RepID=UPI003D67D0F2